MLKITQGQLDSLTKSAHQNLLDRWVDELRAEYPSQASKYADSQFKRLVDGAASDAIGFGLGAPAHVRGYIAALLELNASFNRSTERVPFSQ